MSELKTSDPNKEWAVDVANDLMLRTHRYRMKRHLDDPNPNFGQTRWYLGMKQRSALMYSAHAMMSTEACGDGAKLMDIPVVWVSLADHAALVEVKG